MKIKIFFLIFTIVFLTNNSYSENSTDSNQNNQSKTINTILEDEKRIPDKKNLVDIINSIDQIYGNLYENLKNDQKIVIFFDPAHGKLPNGKWQGGAATFRSSCSNKPEEHYSMKISQKMYNLLSKNKHIEIKTTDDFMDVLKGKSDSYDNIPFSTTIKMAKEANAFIIISEHLNNVSMAHKASGKANIPGIHIIHNYYGQKILTYINASYSGFLTLYNKFDASGFSKNYALKLKEELIDKGLTPNNWEFGAVGDSRFSYFVDFPVSIIYESGFISNPKEEKNLDDPQYIESIVEAQYNALIENIKDTFGVDISKDEPSKNNKNTFDPVELLKLSRIAVYYIKNADTTKGLSVIRKMEKNYAHTKYGNYINYFTHIRYCLQNSESYYSLGIKNKKLKRYRKAFQYFRCARRSINLAPIFLTYHYKYSKEINRRSRRLNLEIPDTYNITPKKGFYNIYVNRASLGTSIILPIEEHQSLEDALYLALAPTDQATFKKLVNSFKKAKIVTRKRIVSYSKKRNRKIYQWKNVCHNAQFHKGIYIVNLNNKLNVVQVKKVSSVHLNPWKYQNHQYLKNSYFNCGERDKEL